MANSRHPEIIALIKSARDDNNNNWMELLEIALACNPRRAKKVFRRINRTDKQISSLLKRLAK